MIVIGLAIMTVYGWLAKFPPVSVALTVKLNVPAVAATPLRTPAGVNVRPAGNVPPVVAKVYDPVPPVAVIVCEYVVPTVPGGKVSGFTVIRTAGVRTTSFPLPPTYEILAKATPTLTKAPSGRPANVPLTGSLPSLLMMVVGVVGSARR